MPEPNNFIVGRAGEVEQFSKLVKGGTKHWLLNIYGPGGIGKTVVGSKMQEYAQSASIPFAFIDGIQPDLTPDRILYAIKDGLARTERLANGFQEFDRQFEEYLIIQEVLQRGGGMQSMFDAVGNVKDPTGFTQVVTGVGKTITEEVKRGNKQPFCSRTIPSRCGKAPNRQFISWPGYRC